MLAVIGRIVAGLVGIGVSVYGAVSAVDYTVRAVNDLSGEIDRSTRTQKIAAQG